MVSMKNKKNGSFIIKCLELLCLKSPKMQIHVAEFANSKDPEEALHLNLHRLSGL